MPPRARASRTTSSRSDRCRRCSTYGDLDEAVTLAARGSGSLVGSVVTHDPAVARTVVLGLAPWHGRILVLDRDDAAESTGHGSPLPMLVHGGPGRAGGGEELGGIRGVLHHMQRTAIQASPDMLTAITGQWTTGSHRTETDVHPFRKSLADLAIGDTISSESRTIGLDDIEHFAEFTGDTFYAHTDPEAAAKNPLFGGIVRPRLPRRLDRGRSVRGAEPGPGARELRRRQPALPDPGQGRRLDLGDADGQADHPAHERRLRRGAVGRAGHQRRRRAVGREHQREAYQALAGLDLPWPTIEVWYGDERWVPVDDPESNEGMTTRAVLLDGVEPAAIHSMRNAGDTIDAAAS